jgi:hypothetical protein
MLRSQAWGCIPVISVLQRLRQEDYKFEASIGYTVKPCLKTHRQTTPWDWKCFRLQIFLDFGIFVGTSSVEYP